MVTATVTDPTGDLPVAVEPSSASDDPDGSRTVALPVELALTGRHADAVRRWVEGTLGWQPVDGATAGLVPPAVVVLDLDAAVASREDGGVPVVLLVDDDADVSRVADAAMVLGPDAVVAWPSQRDALVSRVDEVLGRAREVRGAGHTLRVGGSAGGAGTTTIVYALAGLAAWRGARTLAAVRGTGLPARPMPAAALAGADVWSRADEVPGVPDCRAVRIVDDDTVPDTVDVTIDALVVDLGVAVDVDVLVCRPDRAALETVAATTAAAIVVVGTGPVLPRELGRVAAGRRAVHVPWSARVARAGLAGRLPAGLPGSWLRRLSPLVPTSTTAVS